MELKTEIEEIKEKTNLYGTAELKLNDIYYFCTKCSSTIEIIYLKEKENEIEFKCNNNHYIKMKIKEFIEKIKNIIIKN